MSLNNMESDAAPQANPVKGTTPRGGDDDLFGVQPEQDTDAWHGFDLVMSQVRARSMGRCNVNVSVPFPSVSVHYPSTATLAPED